MLTPMPLAPRVSVVVPVNRGAEALKTSLQSILHQTYQDFEIFVAGDGADGAVERVALSAEDSRVRWFGFPKAPGFGYSNRGRAIGRTSGQLIAYLAPDDLWAPDHLERLVAILDRDRLDLVFSRPILVWADGALRPHYFPFDLARGGLAPPRFLIACVSPTHVLHTREIHDQVGGWTDDLPRHGDVDFWLRCRAAGARIGFLRDATAVRFPSYAFAAELKERHATLQLRLAERLISGDLVLRNLRWSGPRRFAGWIEDALVAGPARGPAWVKALLQRAVGSRLTLNRSEPKA